MSFTQMVSDPTRDPRAREILRSRFPWEVFVTMGKEQGNPEKDLENVSFFHYSTRFCTFRSFWAKNPPMLVGLYHPFLVLGCFLIGTQ